MSGNAKQTAPSRILKRRFHLRFAQFWKTLLVIANGLFPLTLLFALGPIVILAIFVDEVLIQRQYSKITVLITSFLMSLSLAPAMVKFGWWTLINIRSNRNKHLRIAAGYVQSSTEEMLSQAKSAGHQFGLFLRGFEAEAVSTTYYGPNPEVDSREAKIYARHVEALMVEMLSDEVPLVALADPRDPEPMAGVYRFESVPEKWEQFICGLLPEAFPIVMHLTSFTPGVVIELNLIGSPPYASKTVLVVSRSFAIRNSPDGEKLLRLLSDFKHIVFEQLDEDWSRDHEIEFHSRLHASLHVLEGESQGKRAILREGVKRFTVVTPDRLRTALNYIKGPALSLFILMFLLVIITLIIKGPGREGFLGVAGRSFVCWLVMVIVLSTLKWLTFVLGLAPGVGDSKQFPTFSKLMNWMKKYAVTPK